MKPERIKKRFSLLAPVYDTGVFVLFGRALYKAKTYFYSSLPKKRSVLLFGSGTGQEIPELLRTLDPEKLLVVDFSEKMIAKAKKRTQDKRVQFLCGSYADI